MTATSDPINVLLFPKLVINMSCGEPSKQKVLSPSPLGPCTQVKTLIINIGTLTVLSHIIKS